MERLFQIGKEVDQRYGLDPSANPPWTYHCRKSLRQVTEHLERNAARAKHHRGAKLDHGHAGSGKGGTDLVPACQVCGARCVPEGSDINDPANAGPRRGPPEGGGQSKVDDAEPTTGGHRMDEVVGGFDTD